MKCIIRSNGGGAYELVSAKTQEVLLQSNRPRLLSDHAFNVLGAQQVEWQEGVPWE